MRFVCVLVWLILGVKVKAIWLELPSSGTKCVSEDIHNNVVVLADYAVIGDGLPPIVSAKVTSPHGNNLHHQENVTHGQFAFTTTESGNYLACFWMDTKSENVKAATVNLDWKTGIAAKDWESVATVKVLIDLQLRHQFRP